MNTFQENKLSMDEFNQLGSIDRGDVTPEMASAAFQSSSFLQANEPAKQAFKSNIVEYSTMSPKDDRLSKTEMNKQIDSQYVAWHDNSAVFNYFDHGRDMDFNGKTANEFREQSVEKHDYQNWLKTFQPQKAQMKDVHAREMERVERTGDENQIDIMSKKHTFENKLFDYREQQELSKVGEYFNVPTEHYKTSDKQAQDLHDSFRDYTATKLGKTWKHTYANGENEIRNVLEKKIDIVEQELTFDFDKKPQINQNIQKMRQKFSM